jgi:predicted  nucleic acid-binding Zn-ribbon protein
MRQQIRKLERDLLDAQQKCTAVLEELALLKGLGSDASSDLRKVLK